MITANLHALHNQTITSSKDTPCLSPRSCPRTFLENLTMHRLLTVMTIYFLILCSSAWGMTKEELREELSTRLEFAIVDSTPYSLANLNELAELLKETTWDQLLDDQNLQLLTRMSRFLFNACALTFDRDLLIKFPLYEEFIRNVLLYFAYFPSKLPRTELHTSPSNPTDEQRKLALCCTLYSAMKPNDQSLKKAIETLTKRHGITYQNINWQTYFLPRFSELSLIEYPGAVLSLSRDTTVYSMSYIRSISNNKRLFFGLINVLYLYKKYNYGEHNELLPMLIIIIVSIVLGWDSA